MRTMARAWASAPSWKQRYLHPNPNLNPNPNPNPNPDPNRDPNPNPNPDPDSGRDPYQERGLAPGGEGCGGGCVLLNGLLLRGDLPTLKARLRPTC